MSTISPHLAAKLNPRQLEAVGHFEGPLVVLAGAGSGKTRVITYRIAHLVMDRGVRGNRIMAVTFTNKAAGEMKQRVSDLLGSNQSVPWIATFHSTAARLLRRFASEAGLDPHFVIYDDRDQVSMIRKCLKEMNLDEEYFPPKFVASEINRAKRNLIGPDKYDAGISSRHKQIAEAYALYTRRMGESGALDFGDLIYRLVCLLKQDKNVLESLQRQFSWLLVDEFQDTNLVQYEMTKLLAGEKRNLCVVGDDDQSIYTWRGAQPKYILDFSRDFPGTKIVSLEQNYRSTASILKAADGVIKRNTRRHPKTLWTENPGGNPLYWFEAGDDRHEAGIVVDKVIEARDKGAKLKDMAVFYRVNAQSRVLEEVCRARDIAYRIIGAVRFYDREEVKDLLAYLRLVHNPSDVVNFLRIVNKPPRGIGPITQSRILEKSAAGDMSPLEALISFSQDEDFPTAARGRLVQFREQYGDWKELYESGSGIAELARAILEETGYIDGLKAQDTIEARSRLENLAELVGAMDDFETEDGDRSLETFLDYVTLHTSADEVEDGDFLTLMTVHMAKGLEFDTVFIVGMEEGLFPHYHQNLMEDPEKVEEERRLCYVAITRAMKNVYVLNAFERRLFGRSRMNPPSRFLSDIPADLIEKIKVENIREPSSQVPYKKNPKHGKRKSDGAFGEVEVKGWKSGVKVRHEKFGIGMVVGVEEGRNHLKLRIAFPNWGLKTLLSDYVRKVSV